MKNRKWTQVFASVVSVILLCTFLVGFIAPVTVFAAESGSGDSTSSGSASGGENEKPSNSAPKINLKSYAEKLAKNNEKFDALSKSAEVKQTEKDKEKDKEDNKEEGKEEGKEDGKEDGKDDDDDAIFTKEKVADFAKENYNDWVGEAFELISFLKGAAEGEEVDWEKFGVETAKKVIYAFASYLGYGDITKTVIEGLESLLTSGEEPLSEMEKLTDMLDQEFNGMNDKLYEIEDQIGSVSNQITTSVNDILGGKVAEFGSIDDVDTCVPENCKSTYMGYYGHIIAKYKQISPYARFFLVVPPKDGNLEKIARIRTALYELANIFDHTHVIDLYEYAPLYDKEFKKQFFLGGHMNPMGYIITAKMIASYIDYIIRHNPDDFRLAGLIGTQYYARTEEAQKK
jgi:hypothetical protein